MVKLFTHLDLDGIGCAILAKLAFEDRVDITYCDYTDVNEKVKEFFSSGKDQGICIITDISVNDELAKEIDMFCDNYYLLDHHPTALELNKYDWCKVKVEDDQTHIKTSGTELFYWWLIENCYLKNDKVKDRFVELVRNYDTWRWQSLGEDGLICKQVNDLFQLYGREAFINWCLSEIKEGVFPKLYPTENLLLRIRQREIDEYIEKKNEEIIFTELCGKKCGIVFAESYISELGNKLCVHHPEIDFIVMIDMGSKKISYRTTKEDVDLGKDVASVFGGGGHPKAAGSEFEVEVLEATLKNIFCTSE